MFVNELITQLVKQLNISEEQAIGGSGALFKLVKEQLAAGDFAKLTAAVDGIEGLIGKAPVAGGTASMLGGFGSMLGGAAGSAVALGSAASAFKSLGLNSDMITRFAPIVLAYVQKQGGEAVAPIVQKVMDKLAGR